MKTMSIAVCSLGAALGLAVSASAGDVTLDLETTTTTFKNNFTPRAYIEHSVVQNRYKIRVGEWTRAGCPRTQEELFSNSCFLSTERTVVNYADAP